MTGVRGTEPAGTIHVVDPSPLNWLWITYNTVEELVKVSRQGKPRPATNEVVPMGGRPDAGGHLPRGERFSDGSR